MRFTSKAKILITDQIIEEGIAMLKDAGFVVDIETGLSPEELKEKIADYEVLIVRGKTKVTQELIDSAEKLKLTCGSSQYQRG